MADGCSFWSHWSNDRLARHLNFQTFDWPDKGCIVGDTHLDELQQILNYRFQTVALLEEAITHKSCASASQNYERLEFLGDRVLGLVIASALFSHFDKDDQGALTKRYHSLVQQEPLAALGTALSLPRFIRSDNSGQANKRASVISDVVEAIIAAIYLDGGIEAAQGFILAHLDIIQTTADDGDTNPKSALQEWALARGASLPDYQQLSMTGPDHAPHFTVRVSIDNLGSMEGSGSSKKQAERDAARLLLSKLNKSAG